MKIKEVTERHENTPSTNTLNSSGNLISVKQSSTLIRMVSVL